MVGKVEQGGEKGGMGRNEEVRTTCDVCNIIFTWKWYLNVHILWFIIIVPQVDGGHDVYNENEHDLEESGEEEEEEIDPLTNSGEGERAMEGRVSWEVRYSCDICQNLFTSDMNLHLHILMVYNNNFFRRLVCLGVASYPKIGMISTTICNIMTVTKR